MIFAQNSTKKIAMKVKPETVMIARSRLSSSMAGLSMAMVMLLQPIQNRMKWSNIGHVTRSPQAFLKALSGPKMNKELPCLHGSYSSIVQDS